MRRLKFVIELLFICTNVSGKENSSQNYGSTFGIVVSSGIIEKQTELSIGHAFSSKWSVRGTVSIALSQFIKGYEDEEKEHYEEFEKIYENQSGSRNEMFSGSASILYWPSFCHKGPYIRLGTCFGMKAHTDIEVGGGVFIKIWKGIYADIAFGTRLISSFRNEKMDGDGISISIQLKF